METELTFDEESNLPSKHIYCSILLFCDQLILLVLCHLRISGTVYMLELSRIAEAETSKKWVIATMCVIIRGALTLLNMECYG